MTTPTLLPAVRSRSRIHVGSPTDNHNAIIRSRSDLDYQRGFVLSNDHSTFLTRTQALDWAAYNAPEIIDRVLDDTTDGDDPELHARALVDTSASISRRKVLVLDRGNYTYLAQKLGEAYSHVYYYLPESSPYPGSAKSLIGTGLDEIHRVEEFWPYIDKVDLIACFDVYDGEMQHWLRNHGYRVFGSGRGERIELDKAHFLDILRDVGLDVPYTRRVVGVTDLIDYLSGGGEKWIKRSYYRGDFETHKYSGMTHLRPWLDDLRKRAGVKIDSMEFLVQSPIKSDAEVGYDGFCVDGQFTSNCLCGYEIKDKGLVARIFPTTPGILDDVNSAMGEVFKRLGYRGHWSTEIRIGTNGKSYFIDPTCRAPSPPAELMCEIYDNYASAVWDIADGVVPDLRPLAMYGAEIVLTSDWYNNHELCVEVDKSHMSHVKLKNHCRRGGAYYCIPNENGAFFGNVVAYGDSWKSAVDKCKLIVDEIEASEISYDHDVFDKAEEAIDNGAKHGLTWD